MLSSRVSQIILLLAFAALPVVAQQAAPATKAATSDTPAANVITGRVVDERNQPLANANVYLFAVGAPGSEQSVFTDRQGAFQFKGLDRSAYRVSVSAPSYIYPPRDPANSQLPTYRPGDSVTLTLMKGGVVTGTVTNSAGEPVVAIAVRAQMIRDGNGRHVTEGPILQRSTDDRGVYRIYGLPPGTYVLMAGGANSYSFLPNPFELEALTYAPSATRDTAAGINIRAGEETTGVDIRYRAEPGRIVSGQVNMPPDYLSFSVMLMTPEDAEVSWSSFQTPPPSATHSFAFSGISDGDYTLVAQAHAQNGDRSVSTVKRIKVRGADVTGIELTTSPLSSVAGRVILEDSKAPECADKKRAELNEIFVSAWHNDTAAAKEMPRYVWSWGTPVAPDAQGNFTLRSLAAAQYYFIARSSARYWYLQSITFTPPAAAGAKTPSKPIDATRVWTNVKAGDKLTGLSITLAQGAASLRGKIGLGEGEQVPVKLFVILAPAERERADDVLRFYVAPVSADGKIALNNIAPGRYWVLTQTANDESAAPFAKLRQPDGTETRARFRREAEAAKTEIEFKPCQSVNDFLLPLNAPRP